MINKLKAFTLAMLTLMAANKSSAQGSGNNDKNTRKFITEIQTPNIRLDLDSLLRMPAKQNIEYMRAARLRPTVVQLDTIDVHSHDDLANEWSGRYFPNFNAVFLHYFNITPEYKQLAIQDRDAASNIKQANALNADLRATAIHEIIHSEDDARFSPIGLSIYEIMLHGIHMEIAANIKELLRCNRSVYMETGDITAAFPKLSGTATFAPKKWNDPFGPSFGYRGTSSSELYAAYLRDHPNIPAMPSEYEIKIITCAGLMAANELKSHEYLEQFVYVTGQRMSVMNSIYIKEMLKKLGMDPNYRFDGFPAQIWDMYNIEIAGKLVNILEIAGADAYSNVMALANSIADTQLLRQCVLYMEEKNPDFVRSTKMWRETYLKPEPHIPFRTSTAPASKKEISNMINQMAQSMH